MWVLIIAVIVVVIYFAAQSGTKNINNELKKSPALEVADKIKNELTQKGYSVNDEYKLEFIDNDHVGTFSVSSGSVLVGKMICSRYQSPRFSSDASYIRYKNNNVIAGYFYAIENSKIGLLVYSLEESREIPPLIEIAANVIINSGYRFEHPKWIYEYPEAKKYLNVMFQ